MQYGISRASAFTVVLLLSAVQIQSGPTTRTPDEDVNDAAVRERRGLLPGPNLLFNGWGVTPAGHHVPVASDMVMKMVVSPDAARLVLVGGDFKETGVTVLDVRTQYDAGATPMFNAFARNPVLTPFDVRTPQVDLNERNAKTAPFAAESARMNFTEYDRAPEDALNRVLWAVEKPGTPYPAPIHRAIFTIPVAGSQ